MLDRNYWGRGLGTLIASLLAKIAFEDLHKVKVIGKCAGWNSASCRVLEKAGFVREAVLKKEIFKLNEYSDLIIYAKFNEPIENDS